MPAIVINHPPSRLFFGEVELREKIKNRNVRAQEKSDSERISHNLGIINQVTREKRFKPPTTTMVTTNTESVSDEIDVDELIEQKHRPYDPENPPAPATSSYNGVSKSVDVEKGGQKKWDDDMPMGPGHHSADPFAPREGKTLIWRDVNMTLVCHELQFSYLSPTPY